MFAERRNRLTTHFSERIPVVKRCISLKYILIFSTKLFWNIDCTKTDSGRYKH